MLPDLRGHGKSTHLGEGVPWESLTLPRLIRDVEALVDHVAPTGRVHLVGASMGGLLAAHHCARHPGRVGALALLSTPGLPMPGRRTYFAHVQPEGIARSLQGVAHLWHGETYWRDLARHLFALFSRGEPFPDRLAPARALVMQATRDELLAPEEADAWARRIVAPTQIERPEGDHAFFADGRGGSRAANAALRRMLL